MIKLKNLWKIALTGIAMTSLLVACEEPKEDDEVTPGTYTAGTGVYEFTAAKADIGNTYNTWGGFSVLLLNEEQAGKLSTDKDADPFNPKYETGSFAAPVAQVSLSGKNLRFPKYKAATGNAEIKEEGAVVNAAWANLTADNFTVYVDMAQLAVSDVACFPGNDEDTEFRGQAWLNSGRNLDLNGYKPYIIALTDSTDDVGGNKYVGQCSWDCTIYEMKTSKAKKPTSFGKFLDEGNVSAIDGKTTMQAGAKFRIEGAAYAGANGKDMEFKNGKATLDFDVAAGEKNEWAMDYFACWFKFYAGDDTTLAQASKQYYAKNKTTLGKAVELTDNEKEGGNLEVTDLTSAAAGSYTITVDATADPPTITVTKKN